MWSSLEKCRLKSSDAVAVYTQYYSKHQCYSYIGRKIRYVYGGAIAVKSFDLKCIIETHSEWPATCTRFIIDVLQSYTYIPPDNLHPYRWDGRDFWTPLSTILPLSHCRLNRPVYIHVNWSGIYIYCRYTEGRMNCT